MNRLKVLTACALAATLLIPTAPPASASRAGVMDELNWLIDGAGGEHQYWVCTNFMDTEKDFTKWYDGQSSNNLTRQETAEVLYDFCHGAVIADRMGWQDPNLKRRRARLKLEGLSDSGARRLCQQGNYLGASTKKRKSTVAKFAKSRHVSKRVAGQVVYSFCIDSFGS